MLPPTKKSLGQHWLADPTSLQSICDSAQLVSDDVVLEIGPGVGTLTSYLVRQVKRVVAVELDKDLATDLPKNVPASNLEVVQADILGIDFRILPSSYKVVANIPYYLTANLLRILSESNNPPELAVLLVQKEVAERVCAKPGEMSILAVTAQYYWECSLGKIVPSSLFVPPPKVDSQVLILRRRPKPPFQDVDVKQYFRLVKAGFANKRKTLLNSLSSGLGIDKTVARQLLLASEVPEKTRPQELSLDDWHRLYITKHN
jgi:16S rRNA (adenine1518-N6/adenine1519-N6)-dimethyltransferase